MKAIQYLNKISLILAGCMFISLSVSSQGTFAPWPVPAADAALANPTPNDKAARTDGMNLYTANCKSCHGEKGQGNGIIPAANLTTVEFQSQSDGAIFYKLIAGRGTMPSFRSWPEHHLWHVVHYLRTFGAGMQVVKKKAGLYVRSAEQNGKKLVFAHVSRKDTTGTVMPLENVKIKLGVKRYFGELPVGGEVFTNADGNAVFTYADSTILGDSAGNIVLMARLDDLDYESTVWSDTVQWGVVNNAQYWTDRRALWKNNDYVPIWLMATFGGILALVAGVILFVLLRLKKIWELGKQS